MKESQRSTHWYHKEGVQRNKGKDKCQHTHIKGREYIHTLAICVCVRTQQWDCCKEYSSFGLQIKLWLDNVTGGSYATRTDVFKALKIRRRLQCLNVQLKLPDVYLGQFHWDLLKSHLVWCLVQTTQQVFTSVVVGESWTFLLDC